MIVELYLGLLLPQQPISHITPAKCERNEEIRHRHRRGESLASLAEVFGISEQRVSQIVQGKRS
jgi:Mor family transcriptional regulator